MNKNLEVNICYEDKSSQEITNVKMLMNTENITYFMELPESW